VAQPKNTPPLPPFEKWAFAPQHYMQYLADLLTVHVAVDTSLNKYTESVLRQEKSCNTADYEANNNKNSTPSSLSSSFSTTSSTTTALATFSKALLKHLSRSKALQHDIDKLNIHINNNKDGSNTTTTTTTTTTFSTTSLGGGGGPNAVGYSQYLQSLSQRYSAAETKEERQDIELKLFANAYLIHLIFLTSGMRIGAAATEKLNLFNMGALAAYEDFDDDDDDDDDDGKKRRQQPLEMFMEAVNEYGRGLDEEAKEGVVEEVRHCFGRVSLLLTALAREK
jgi:hypothetical protein